MWPNSVDSPVISLIHTLHQSISPKKIQYCWKWFIFQLKRRMSSVYRSWSPRWCFPGALGFHFILREWTKTFCSPLRFVVCLEHLNWSSCDFTTSASPMVKWRKMNATIQNQETWKQTRCHSLEKYYYFLYTLIGKGFSSKLHNLLIFLIEPVITMNRTWSMQ
jgi:hypothetical protein